MEDGRDIAKRYMDLLLAAHAAGGASSRTGAGFDPTRVACTMISLGAALIANAGTTSPAVIKDTIDETFQDADHPIRQLVAGLVARFVPAAIAASMAEVGVEGTMRRMEADGWTVHRFDRKKGGEPS